MYNKYKTTSVLYLTILFLNLYISISAQALDPDKKIHQFVHQSLKTEDGLPQSSIQTIAQTKNGYIWLGTEEGLVRFDGVKFKVFNKKNTSVLKHNNIKALYVDKYASLWIGTFGGGLLKYVNKKFQLVLTLEAMPDKRVTAVTGDNTGNIWIATKSGGLIKYNSGQYILYRTKNGLSSDKINTIFTDSNNNLWIGTFDAGISLYKDNRFTNYNKSNGLLDNNISAIYEDKNGTVWVSTSDGKLYNYKNNKFLIFQPEKQVLENRVQAIMQDKDNNLWFGTFGSGLFRQKNGKTESFTSKDGLTNNMIFTVFEDQEGNIWIGTYKGLNILKESKFKVYTEKDGLSQADISAIFEDSNNNLWVGTWDEGLNRFTDNKFTSYTTLQGLSGNQVKSIYEDKNKNLWIGTYDGGLTLYSNNNFKSVSKEDGLSHNSVLAITEDKNGYLWFGTYGGGLNRYKDGKFDVFTSKDGLSGDEILSIYEDRKGNIWIGTEGGGLSLYKDGKFSSFTKKDGFYTKMVLVFYEDNQDNLWIGTREGLYLYKENKFTMFTSKEGLFDDTILVILEDHKNNFWMSSNNGIFTVNRKNLLDFAEGKTNIIKSENYGLKDGLKTQECNGGFQHAGYKTKNGILYFPTINGLVRIDPENIYTNKVIPSVIIENFITDNKKQDITKHLKLEANTNNIEIHYTVPSFTSPDKVSFEYMLKGIDEKWINVNTRRTAYYTTIPPGNYKFIVKACNSDSFCNKTGTSIKFEKAPHFYQTNWFYLLCALIVIIAFYGIHYYQVKKEKTKQKRLEMFNVKLKNEVDKQTLELKKRNQELNTANENLNEKKTELEKVLSDLKISQQKMVQQARMASLGNLVAGVSHEIGNPLNASISGSDLIGMTIEDAENTFADLPVEPEDLDKVEVVLDRLKGAHELIYEGNQRINKIINNFRSFLQSDKASIENYNIEDGIKSCVLLLNKRIESQKIKVSTHFDKNLPSIKCKSGEINQVITNLLINSLDVMPKTGKIKIAAKLHDNSIKITFTDSGPGIPKRLRDSVFDPFFTTKDPSKGTGLGLYMSHEIISGLGGDLSIIDSEKGASFLIQLPVKRN